MLNLRNTLLLSLISLASLGSASAFAERPIEPVTKNFLFDNKNVKRSNSVQGLGNRILGELSSARYQIYHEGPYEYALNFKGLSITNDQYTGNPADLVGYIFFKIWVVIDGYEGEGSQKQTTTFVPSQYNSAIHLKKMDRDEKRSYEFDIGIDSKNRLYLIRDVDDVTYLTPSDTHKKYVSIKERNKKYVF